MQRRFGAAGFVAVPSSSVTGKLCSFGFDIFGEYCAKFKKIQF
jgi:hypothetical protein